MQGSKQIERAVRTRTKNPERVAKALERAKKARSITERRALRSVGAI